ncbi:MAG: hypothetical protein CEO19_45 [Parcubacteria group bacterium Gr01-1014_73]|nr:MAG: hypothetical protein CEO19_45 [Parcubacteria group bacterium Gr01-1014_73]
MAKLPLKDKIFWKNYLLFIIIFIIASTLLGYAPEDGGESVKYSFLNGYLATSFFAVLWLGYKLAKDFAGLGDAEDKE